MERQRDERGRLLPGNSLGKLGGSPLAAITIELRKAFLSVCTPEAMEEVTRRHLELIRQDGDRKVALAAIGLLYERLFGKPRESLDVKVSAPSLDPGNYSDDQLTQILGIIEAPARRIDMPALPAE